MVEMCIALNFYLGLCFSGSSIIHVLKFVKDIYSKNRQHLVIIMLHNHEALDITVLGCLPLITKLYIIFNERGLIIKI